MEDRLEDFERLSKEKDKLEALLKSAQIELQNYELFKQQVDEEKLIAIQNVETNLKSHYDESIKYQLNELKSKLNAQFEQERNGLQQKNEKLLNEVKSLEGANDEIKNDYCQLAAEKETIERHYENLESKLKSINAS